MTAAPESLPLQYAERGAMVGCEGHPTLPGQARYQGLVNLPVAHWLCALSNTSCT